MQEKESLVDAMLTKRTWLTEPQPPKAVFDAIATLAPKHQQPLQSYLAHTTNLLLCSDIVSCAMLSMEKQSRDLVTSLSTELDRSLAAQRELVTVLEAKQSIECNMAELARQIEETRLTYAHKWDPPLCMYMRSCTCLHD
jgi:hypothetical protein